MRRDNSINQSNTCGSIRQVFSISAADPRIFAVGSHQELNSQSHIFVVQFFAIFVAQSLPFVCWLLVIHVSPENKTKV